MKNKILTGQANAVLEPLIRYAAEHRGTIVALQERLRNRTGKTVHRANLERWLHPEPKKRTQPSLGMGLLLAEEGRKLMLLDPVVITRTAADMVKV